MNFSGIDMGELGRKILSKVMSSTSSYSTYDDTLDECEV